MRIARLSARSCSVLPISIWLGVVVVTGATFGAAFVEATESGLLARGPYLQLGTSTSVVIRWRTCDPTDSRVRYGFGPDQLDQTVEAPATVMEHEVTLRDLDPNTRYYYSIGTTTDVLAGGDLKHFFVTAPSPGTSQPIRIWAIGDSGTNNGAPFNFGHVALAVWDQYREFAGDRHTDVWLMLGDNAYNRGTDEEYQHAVFETYPDLLSRTVLWPAMGNHERLSSDSLLQTGPYYESFTLPAQGEAGGTPSRTEAYYSFDYANVHFVCLESDIAAFRAPGSVMLDWLREDLAATTQTWIIAYFHHTPYSRGSRNSDGDRQMTEVRENVAPVLEENGVDLVLAAHSHVYERSYLLRGHHDVSFTLSSAVVLDCGDGRPGGDGAYHKTTVGPDAGQGTVYVVCGTSGEPKFFGSLDHPAMFFSSRDAGSLVIDVNDSRMDVRFLSTIIDGVLDHFVIEKGPEERPPGQPCVDFVRGNVNDDDTTNLADVVFILDWLFAGGRESGCVESADTDSDNTLRIGDAIFLATHLFAGGPAPAFPYLSCGPDESDLSLGCQQYSACP